MSGARATHLGIGPDEVAGNAGRGRWFFLPGSPARARRIADRFEGVTTHENPRRLDVHLGTLRDGDQALDVGVVSTGMGAPSVGIVVTELIQLGARRLLRIGSAGTMVSKHVHNGDLVIATAAVRDEGASDAFGPREVPAVAHPDWVVALGTAAVAIGEAERTFRGVVHTKDAFYGREFPAGPLAERNAEYMDVLRKLGVLASEMEAAHLFMLAATHGPDRGSLLERAGAAVVKAGAVLAIVGDHHAFAPDDVIHDAEERAIGLGLAGGLELARLEAGSQVG